MLTIYKDGLSQDIHGIDLPGWLEDGWGLEPPPESALANKLVNLNESELAELRKLPGVTVSVAKKLIENRPLTPEKLGELGIEVNLDLVTF